ncbi:MAG TPA: L-threonylcarbamoyladenylate synthase [Burkholderiales bacterium]|jgi:tRNA threonylcarbamoyl adenosine modification protein (Sua5/YciO/YrdC/YwlC family)|nr:L-threonylcarbamoyladenylate synthase [Burkholderiales bacterium]
MAQFFSVHPTHPQARLVRRAAQMVRRGALIAYPTDSCYALGCQLGNARALERLRRVRGIDARHHLTLMCRDLSEIAAYAIVDDARFRLLKRATPGSYTFILRATREVPRRLLHARRKTIGVRVPGHAVAHALLAELDQPMLSATLSLPGTGQPLSDPHEIRDRLEHELDLVIDAGSCGVEPTTVIDLTADIPVVLRAGKGSLAPFAVETV